MPTGQAKRDNPDAALEAAVDAMVKGVETGSMEYRLLGAGPWLTSLRQREKKLEQLFEEAAGAAAGPNNFEA